MRRPELEHIIGAAGAVAAVDAVVIVGSHAILASHPDAPEELLASRGADLYPLAKPHLADLIDGAIGEGSPFEEEFGYYAHGVGPETAVLPPGWEGRGCSARSLIIFCASSTALLAAPGTSRDDGSRCSSSGFSTRTFDGSGLLDQVQNRTSCSMV